MFPFLEGSLSSFRRGEDGFIPTELCDTPQLRLIRALFHMLLEAYVVSRQMGVVRCLEEQSALFLTLDMSLRLTNELVSALSSLSGPGVLLDHHAVTWPYEVAKSMDEGDVHAMSAAEDAIESIHNELKHLLSLCGWFNNGVIPEMVKLRIRTLYRRMISFSTDSAEKMVTKAIHRRIRRRRSLIPGAQHFVGGTTITSDVEWESCIYRILICVMPFLVVLVDVGGIHVFFGYH